MSKLVTRSVLSKQLKILNDLGSFHLSQAVMRLPNKNSPLPKGDVKWTSQECH